MERMSVCRGIWVGRVTGWGKYQVWEDVGIYFRLGKKFICGSGWGGSGIGDEWYVIREYIWEAGAASPCVHAAAGPLQELKFGVRSASEILVNAI